MSAYSSRLNSVEIRFAGQKITLKTAEDDPALVESVVALVTQLLEQAGKRTKGAAAHQVALVALMDLAAEYVQAKRLAGERFQSIESSSSRLIELIESNVGSSGK